jgi:ribosomal protein S12 methylthiotransferase
VKINGIEWIRLHYAYPHKFPLDIINIINKQKEICKYLDIPFQHISDKMLGLMRRGNNKDQALNLIKMLRQEIPGIALRTTLLVGHPGETEADFNELLEFVIETRFDRLGVFIYSHEEHSYAYKMFNDDIPHEIKQFRYDSIMQAQQKISSELNHYKIGKNFKVLMDREESGYWIGRTEFDSPEVDNEVLIPNSSILQIGEFYNILITDANEYDLFGKL